LRSGSTTGETLTSRPRQAGRQRGEKERYVHRNSVDIRGSLSRVPLDQVDRMHAAFTKSAMLHVTVWTRAYVDNPGW
jgi:hypothetical protein